jgi:hypothetical protein
MDAQELRNLQEAYNTVFEARVDKKLPEHERSGARLKRYDNPSGALALGGGQQRARRAEHEERRGVKKEEVDIYDIILSHLLDGGYADTQQAAEAIMVNMSEEWRGEIMEGMTMKDFKANRRNIKRKEASADARKRGHEGKTWADSGKTYSPDQAKRNRANMTDATRQALYRVANNPDDDGGDDHYPASKTNDPKKLRKQKAMGEHG